MESAVCLMCANQEVDCENEGYDYEYWTSSCLFQFVRCKQCGHLFLSPRPSRSSASLIYPVTYSTYQERHSKDSLRLISFFKNRVILNRLKMFEPYFRNGYRILDIGCGDGQLLRALKIKYPGVSCTGMDIFFSPNVKKQLQNLQIELIESAVEDAGFSGPEYDLIIMNQLIEHLWEPHLVLDKLHSALSPGGYISIETINICGYDKRIFRDGSWGGYYFPRHMNLFSFATLKALMEKHGFVVKKQVSLLAPVCWVFSCHGWLQKKLGRKSALAGFFSDANPVIIAVFTLVELFAVFFGRTTSNQKMIASKEDVV